MKTVIILIIIAVLAAASDPIKDGLEEIAANWYKVGFTCGQADILVRNGGSLPVAEVACAKWNARFGKKP